MIVMYILKSGIKIAKKKIVFFSKKWLIKWSRKTTGSLNQITIQYCLNMYNHIPVSNGINGMILMFIKLNVFMEMCQLLQSCFPSL